MEPKQKKHLEEHIPYRLAAVGGFRWFLEKLLDQAELSDVSMSVDGLAIQVRYYALTNALVDAGLAHGRALCEFIGFVRKKGAGALSAAGRTKKSGDFWMSRIGRARKGGDFWIEDLHLPIVSPGAACEIGPESSVEIEDALVYFLRTANTGVAHLTVGSSSTDLRKLHLATHVISRLVTKHVYQPLNLESLLDKRHHPCPYAEASARLLSKSLC